MAKKKRQDVKKEKNEKNPAKSFDFKTTADVPVPEKLVDWIIGQDRGVRIIKKAAAQRRNVLLIGQPGTGKSMLAQAMAELMPSEDLEDVLVYPNLNDENQPIVKTVKTFTPEMIERYKKEGKKPEEWIGQGRILIEQERAAMRMQGKGISPVLLLLLLSIGIMLVLSFTDYGSGNTGWIFAATILGLFIFGAAYMLTSGISKRIPAVMEGGEPKLIVDNSGRTTAPFIDATGARAGALFGDVRHDPLQCIPQGECVLLGDGNPIPIEHIVDPFFSAEKSEGRIDLLHMNRPSVLGVADSGFEPQPAEVASVYRRRYAGKLVRITTRSGCCIKVTPNHPIATLREDGTITYLPAADVKAGDIGVILEALKQRKQNGLVYGEPLLLFVGDVLADGQIDGCRIKFKLKRRFKIKHVLADAKMLGLTPTVSKGERGTTTISVNSAELCRWFELAGAKKGRFKFVPYSVFTLKPELVARFLARIISLDGYVNPQGQFELRSANRRFLQQIRALLFIFGVNAKYEPKLDRLKKGNLLHRLRWNHYEWAKTYAALTINPVHKRNLRRYLANRDDWPTNLNGELLPAFTGSFLLQRRPAGVSTGLNSGGSHPIVSIQHSPSTLRNTGLLDARRDATPCLQVDAKKYVVEDIKGFGSHPLAESRGRLPADKVKEHAHPTDGLYAFDEITYVSYEPYDGFVYNLTTETGNYFVDFMLTHNSGGLGTPAHLRVESGAIHRANKGVLFVDEVSSLTPKSQQDLLTAMQDKKFSITGQSEMSSGALVKTQPVPCDFVLVAAGNLLDIQNMHPALRSRIRGYGYEVYMDDSMPDTKENQRKLVQFVAQEVKKDGKIPHFSRGAVEMVIEEARRKAGRKGRLTLRLRELGGLVRAAGDIAREQGAKVVLEKHVIAAREVAAPLEQQISKQLIDFKKDYKVFATKGFKVGRVNGLAVLGEGASGLVLPIVAEVTPASSRSEGKLIATGKLGEIAKEAVENVSAILKKHIGRDVSNYDMHVQFLQTYEGVEGDSASISIAVAVLSAMEGIPVNQSVAMTGSLSVRGEVLPVGGITAKVEAAIDAGCKSVIIPKANENDIYIEKKKLKKIKVIPVSNIEEVLEHSLKDCVEKERLIKGLPW